MSQHSTSGSDDAVVIDRDDISNYNPEQILPESEEELRKIRAWLKPTNYALDSGEFRKHLTAHLPGTNAWLMQSRPYQDWLQDSKVGTLSIKGIPGSGKSVIAAHLIDELTRTNPGSPVLYFFFRQIIDANHEPAALLRDWLDQILAYSPPLQKRLKELVKSGRSVSSMAMEDQWSNLKLAIDGISSNVYCVADALDEMDQGHEEFLQSLAALGQWNPSKVRVLFTSRPVPIVEAPLRHFKAHSIRLIEEEIDVDIASYVNHGLESSRIPAADQERIRTAIPGRANGLFLYAKLALDAFLEPGAHIEKVMQALPSDLHDMYTRLLREHARRSGVPDDIQLLILQCVTHSTRPLRLLELAEMLESIYNGGEKRDLKERKNLVRAATGPLLEILPDETVCVIHHSFTEYLKCITRSEGDGGYPVLRPGPTHGRLAEACLTYLSSGCLDTIKLPQNDRDPDDSDYAFGGNETLDSEEQQIRLRHPFFSYAATNWHIHVVRSASAGFSQDKLNLAINDFLSHRKRRKAWLKLRWSNTRKQVHGPTALHIAARYGLHDYARFLLTEHKADVHAKDAAGKTPLWFAASAGHANLIRLLVSAGAEPDVYDNSRGLKPLHEAAKENHAAAVTALLEAGVDPFTKKIHENPGNWCGNASRTHGHTPLMYACKNGHLEALEAFLPFLRDADAVNRALNWSAYKGRSKLVRRILQHPMVDVNAKVNSDTALVAACRSSDRDTIVALIEAGADPTILCENLGPEFGGVGSGRYDFGGTAASKDQGFTALHALRKRRTGREKLDPSEWQEVFELLLSKGVNIHQREHDGRTALHMAVNEPVAVRLLLDAGADANTVDNHGWTPLQQATHPESISLLVELGHADINKVHPSEGKTPILLMLDSHHTEAALRLLQYSPDLKIRDKSGNGPLHIRIKKDNTDTVVLKALLDAGADPNERNLAGETPLLGMHVDGRLSTVFLDLLLGAGADINARDFKGSTLLLRSMGGGFYISLDHQDVETLLEKGADINVRDFDGRTLLHVATAYHPGSESFMYSPDRTSRLDYLLTKNLDVHATDYHGNTLLHELALRDHILSGNGAHYISLAKQLISLGIDPNQKNHVGRTALHILAASTMDEDSRKNRPSEHRNIFDFLLSKRVNINEADNEGLTALHLASTVSESTVRSLLDAGADPTMASTDGLTPLHLAARTRQVNILGQLLDAVESDKKAFVRSKDKKGHTALYYACMSGVPETVRLLIDAGADASKKALFNACASFEAEQSKWDTNKEERRGTDRRKPNIQAAGLTLDDKTRPASACKKALMYSELDMYGNSARLDEILDMLIDNGADIHSLEYRSILDAATAGHQYTVDCFVRAKDRHPRSPDSEYRTTRTVLFIEEASRSHMDAQVRAVRESKMVAENEPNLHIIELLLKQRQYHTMPVLFERDVNFLAVDKERLSPSSALQMFVRSGLARLLDEMGELEADRQLALGHWHAFNDKSKRGLYKELDPKDSDRNPNKAFLLYDAVVRALPNMEVVRLLVEKFHVDVNQIYYTQSYNYEEGGYKYLPDGTVLHHVAKGSRWWQAALALPYLISQGADLNIRDFQGRTPLHIALGTDESLSGASGRVAAEALIKAGADLDIVDNKGRSCLAYASDQHGLMKLLVNNGATIDAHAIFAAVEHKRVQTLETLLSTGADPNMRRSSVEGVKEEWAIVSNCEQYPLWAAATIRDPYRNKTAYELKEGRNSTLQILEILLAHGADPFSVFKRKRRDFKASRGEILLCDEDEKDEDDDAEFETTVLHDLLEHDKMVHPILKKVVLGSQSGNSDGRTVLHAASLSKFGLHAPIDALFARADPDYKSSDDNTPTFLDLLLARGANILEVDNENRNILHLMLIAHNDHPVSGHPILSVLPLLSDADKSVLVNQADVYGCTPLHYATQYAVVCIDTSPAEALLEAGANPSALNKRGENVLHHLAFRIYESEVIRSLFTRFLSLSLDINAADNFGQTPVFNLNKALSRPRRSPPSAAKNHVTPTEALALFEDAGADLLARDKQGRGLLHIVVQSREPGIADIRGRRAMSKLGSSVTRFELLLRKGLDPLMEDDQKRTPLDIAAACDHEGILKLFDKDNVRNKVLAEEIERQDDYDSDDMGF